MRRSLNLLGGAAFALSLVTAQALTPIEELGKQLFFDQNLSAPPGQSCASCHDPGAGFTGPDSRINAGQAVFPGAVHSRAGSRKPPTAAYAGNSPVLHLDKNRRLWIGGMFSDGRATGWTLGDPLAEQALQPFLNDVEQNLVTPARVVHRVANSRYAKNFEEVWGAGSLRDKRASVTLNYERIGHSIAAYERSQEVNPFTSKYDYYLKGRVSLTAQEAHGLALFNFKARCAVCHPSQLGPNGEPPLFTDFSYANLGIPKNPLNPFYRATRRRNPDGPAFVDPGLAKSLADAGHPEPVWVSELGKHKVPTLRNVDKRPAPDFVRAYGHNGFFKSLEEITRFYNTRDVATWPAPEVPVNMNTTDLGNLGLSAQEEAAIVAFLKTLTDGYRPPDK